MKKFIVYPVCAVLIILSCSSNKESFADETSKKECLIGEWSYVENGVKRSFSFNKDKTGREVMTASDVRPYRWTNIGDTVSIIYDSDASGKSWDFTLNCNDNILTVFGLSYRK